MSRHNQSIRDITTIQTDSPDPFGSRRFEPKSGTAQMATPPPPRRKRNAADEGLGDGAKPKRSHEEQAWLINALCLETPGGQRVDQIIQEVENKKRRLHGMKDKADTYEVMFGKRRRRRSESCDW